MYLITGFIEILMSIIEEIEEIQKMVDQLFNSLLTVTLIKS